MARDALQDTTLPVGGGPSQEQPIFIAKGTMVQTSFYALHREPAVFGKDTEEFFPERWRGIQPKQWEYVPFGGGQRACLGKGKVLAESAFVICRLAQTFERLQSRDTESWNGQQTLTAKNANGCKVALYCG
jgi:cytochrome P450